MGTTEKVMILMGSKNDWASMKGCCETLRSFGVVYRVHVASAHRTPERVEKLIREGEANGIEVFIAAAGMAAHLAGAVAAKTTRPVIGVPMAGSALQGFDALLSTVQMPPGIPVLTVAVGHPGAVNAAIAAVQILALHDAELRQRLASHRVELARSIEKQDQELEQEK
jgi:5-(carboxyamino)imidazole ribonucleotide mutase